MNKKIIIILILILFSIALITTNAFSQIQFFDSIRIVASSSLYSYKNPVFEDNRPYINTSRISYERHQNGYSDIIIRSTDFNGYGSEIVITDSLKALNINPTFSENIIVWQSNVRGNWDLFYSIYSNSNWSQPHILDSSLSNETNPYISNNYSYPIQYNNYYLVYKKDNSIRFKKYHTLDNAWDLDTNVTLDSNEYITPYLVPGPDANQYSVIYLRKYSNELSKINRRIFFQPLSPGSINWDSPFEVNYQNSQDNLSIAQSYSRFIIYSYDTLGTKHLIGITVGGENYREVFTKNIPGRHLAGNGSLNSIITDNPYYAFSAFICLTRSNDSTQLTFINRPNTYNENPEFKNIYLGDTNLITKFDLSNPIYQQNFYKIKAVWEKQINNETALVESSMIDFFAFITNNSQSKDVFNLSQNYPNPFNPKTVINYVIPSNVKRERSNVELIVYNTLGKEVTTLVNQKQNAGSYSVSFDGSNLSSGIYFYSLLIDGNIVDTKQMVLLK